MAYRARDFLYGIVYVLCEINDEVQNGRSGLTQIR